MGSALLTNLRPHPDRVVALERYARLAEAYDASCDRIREQRELAVSVLDAQPGDTVIDVASGTGATLPSLASRVGPSGLVVGVEQSEAMMRVARARIGVGGLPSSVVLVGAPINLWCCWRARSYLTTFHGLRLPWARLAVSCEDVRLCRAWHCGTSFLLTCRVKGDGPLPTGGGDGGSPGGAELRLPWRVDVGSSLGRLSAPRRTAGPST